MREAWRCIYWTSTIPRILLFALSSPCSRMRNLAAVIHETPIRYGGATPFLSLGREPSKPPAFSGDKLPPIRLAPSASSVSHNLAKFMLRPIVLSALHFFGRRAALHNLIVLLEVLVVPRVDNPGLVTRIVDVTNHRPPVLPQICLAVCFPSCC